MSDRELEKGLELRERYRIEKKLGQGGFSVTYLATDLRMQVPVTLKQYDMSKSLTEDEAKREAQLAAGFYDLEGIAAARDYFEEQGTFFIVMEYVDGINITDFIRQHGVMAGKEVLEKMRPILHSLSQIHEKGVIHRDISGDNLILSPDGKLKLIDFGAARQRVQDNGKPYTLIYKRGFAPIEQCQSHGVQGPWTDVYAVCCTMYFMLTGIVPDDAVDRMIHDRMYPLGNFMGTGLGRRESIAIMKGMAVEVKERYASINELYYELYNQKLERACSAETNWTYVENRGRRKNTTYLIRQVERFYRRKRQGKKYLPVVVLAVFLVMTVAFFVWRGSVMKNPEDESVVAGSEHTNIVKAGRTEEETPEEEDTKQPVVSPSETKQVRVKDYRGKSYSIIQKELKEYQENGLKIRIKKKYSAKKKGTILSQTPVSGHTYDSWEGVTLTLTVSKGEAPTPAPASTPNQDKKKDKGNRKKDDVTFHGSLTGIKNITLWTSLTQIFYIGQ